jgi:hypothetical protein
MEAEVLQRPVIVRQVNTGDQLGDAVALVLQQRQLGGGQLGTMELIPFGFDAFRERLKDVGGGEPAEPFAAELGGAGPESPAGPEDVGPSWPVAIERVAFSSFPRASSSWADSAAGSAGGAPARSSSASNA